MKKRLVSLLLVLSTALSVLLSLSSCSNDDTLDGAVGSYTYKDSVTQMSSNWNPHTYQTVAESYPIEYLTAGLYSIIYNDALNPNEGKEPYTSYKIVPEMAAAMPKDVTEEVKAKHPEFGIPASASKGYAYIIELNPDACWENGTPINADTYIYSMKQLFDPELLNYRATDYFSGALSIAGAEEYYYQKSSSDDNAAGGKKYSFDNVGIFKNDEYSITLVLDKSLAGFQLLYSLTGNFIVYEPYYEKYKKEIAGTGTFTSSYNTSLESTMSYGPYKLTSFERDKSMTFVKNESWYGYKDGAHIYVDPYDKKTYPMYQTTRIETQVVKEAETRKLMFLKGELMSYGLGTDDYQEYKDSEYCYITPSETVFFFIFNGYKDALLERESAEGFDTGASDLETLTLTSFRRAIALSYNKEDLCVSVSPSRMPAYGLIGNSYIYDPETAARYRNTDVALKAICDFYSVDTDKYESLSDAAESVTGYNVERARELYREAYEESLEAGYITDTDADGLSDQTVEIVYAASASTPFITKTLDYLNEKIKEVTKGTPFDGKIVFKQSSPLGNDWSNRLKAGMADVCLAGWSGSVLDPFGLTDLYTNPAYQYDAKWFDSSSERATLEINVSHIGDGERIKTLTMSLREWSDALNGAVVTVEGEEYCFGDGIAQLDTRLKILAMLETRILSTYNYIPMLQDASLFLLSKQVYYVVEEYNPIVGRGGLRYLRYNYDDKAWSEYVNRHGSELSY